MGDICEADDNSENIIKGRNEMKQNFRILHVDVRSLASKISLVEFAIETEGIDILCKSDWAASMTAQAIVNNFDLASFCNKIC